MTDWTAAEQDKLIEGARQEMDLKLKQASDLAKAYASDLDLWKSDDLMSITARALFRKLTSDLELQATFTASYQGMIRELSEARDTPLIRRFVELAALCWFRWQVTEGGYPGPTGADRYGAELINFWDRHLAAVQWRYMRALEALARARRLPLPVVQVNIADKQQVNVGHTSRR
jgi:hypothetical protein